MRLETWKWGIYLGFGPILVHRYAVCIEWRTAPFIVYDKPPRFHEFVVGRLQFSALC